jgi:phosphatidylserine/phosphatidylglycerophosphate/cardiolipin synthase-like enzyme
MSNELNFDSLQVFTSLDGHFVVKDTLAETMAQTKEKLLISSPWVGKGFVDIMRNTLPDGVSIHLITQLPKDNYETTFDAIASLYQIGKDHNWKLTIMCASRHHPKFIVIDDTICLAGSLNPTESGLFYNLELGFKIYSHDAIDKITNFFYGMERASISWDKFKTFHGIQINNFKHPVESLIEDYKELFFRNANTQMKKYETVKQLRLQGYQENNIVEVQRQLIRSGIFYEPKLDYICLTCPEC